MRFEFRGFGISCVLGALCSVVGVAQLPASSLAAGNADARVLIHLTAPTTKTICPSGPTCAGVQTAGLLYPRLYFASVLLVDGDANAGIGGVEFGVTYDDAPGAGVDVFNWTSCGALEYPTTGWPHSGTGNIVAWGLWEYGLCQHNEPGGPGTGVTASLGYFYMAAYSPDVLAVTPRPVTGLLQVSDCVTAQEVLLGGVGYSGPSRMGSAKFTATGNEAGYNPCSAVVPARSTTWSALKGMAPH